MAEPPPMHAALWPGPGPAVVLLHGQPGTAGDWQWVVPRLESRYSLVVPDRPGYGRTGGPAVGFAANATAVAGLLDDLGIDRAVVVGHSWSGGVAMAFAAAHPERTAGLVLVSSVGPGEPVGWDDRLLALPVVGEVLSATAIGGLGFLLGRSRVQEVAGRRLGGRAYDAVTALTRLTSGRGSVWRSFVAEQRSLLDELEDLGPLLPTIHAPTAVVHGSRDRVVPVEVARANAAAIPTASLRIVAGAGHLIPHDRPDAIADAIDDVVSRPPGSTGGAGG